jgi:hypothetical protein
MPVDHLWRARIRCFNNDRVKSSYNKIRKVPQFRLPCGVSKCLSLISLLTIILMLSVTPGVLVPGLCLVGIVCIYIYMISIMQLAIFIFISNNSKRGCSIRTSVYSLSMISIYGFIIRSWITYDNVGNVPTKYYPSNPTTCQWCWIKPGTGKSSFKHPLLKY